MRLLCISGISLPFLPRARKQIWPNIESGFRGQYPEIDEVKVERLNPRCRPWDFDEMRAFCDELVERYDDGKETIFVGHSAGGVFACYIAERFAHTSVRGIVTICTPHRLMRDLYPRKLKVRNDTDIPIITMGGIIDGIVPVWATKHPQSRQHRIFRSTHRVTLAERLDLSEQLALIAKQEFS